MGLGSLLFFAILFFLMMRFGCGSHIAHGHSSPNKNKAGKYIDPVCDMEVEEEEGYGKMHEGELYRFCTRSCLDKFDANPDTYLNKKTGEHQRGM